MSKLKLKWNDKVKFNDEYCEIVGISKEHVILQSIETKSKPVIVDRKELEKSIVEQNGWVTKDV